MSEALRTALGEPGDRILRDPAFSFCCFAFLQVVLRTTFFRNFKAFFLALDAFSRKALFAAASCLFVLPPCTRTTLRGLDTFFFLRTGEAPTVFIHELFVVCSFGGSILFGVIPVLCIIAFA